MKKYKLADAGIVREDGAFIPSFEGNRDWQDYQSWLQQGNTPDPAEPSTPVVPSEVSMRQARLALCRSGNLEAVNQAIAAMPGAAGNEARITWEFAADVKRGDPLVAAMAQALSLSSADLDQLFTMAASL